MNGVDFDCAVEGMQWVELISTLQDMIIDMLRETLNSILRSALPPPPGPPGQGLDTHFQLVESLIGGYIECVPLGAAPLSFQLPSPLTAAPGLNVEQPAPIIYQGPSLFNQNSMHSQGQYNNVTVVKLPEGQSLPPVGMLNGETVYDVEGESDSAPPPLNTSMLIKRENQQHGDRPYVKKPPNAFMLYMKEQRPNVVARLNIKESAAVNTILGKKWKSLSKEEQAKYFNQANKERLLHARRHPDWSSNDNYGKKRKRQRSKAPIRTEASASKPEDVTHQAKKVCVTPAQTVIEADLIEAPLTQTVLMQPPPSTESAALVLQMTESNHNFSITELVPLMMEQLEIFPCTAELQLPSSP